MCFNEPHFLCGIVVVFVSDIRPSLAQHLRIRIICVESSISSPVISVEF